jgi:hypothetical protein
LMQPNLAMMKFVKKNKNGKQWYLNGHTIRLGLCCEDSIRAYKISGTSQSVWCCELPHRGKHLVSSSFPKELFLQTKTEGLDRAKGWNETLNKVNSTTWIKQNHLTELHTIW